MRYQLLLTGLVCICQNGLATTVTPHCYTDVHQAYQALIKDKKRSQLININTASVVDLTTLAGVGHQTAQAIVNHRSQYGQFASVDELAKVKGIGKATIDKNRHRLTVLHLPSQPKEK